MFQQTVSIQQGFGVPGEFFTDAPWIVETYTITSVMANNIIGATCCTMGSVNQQCNAGGVGIFAGFLCNPKTIALYGSSGVPLAPTLNVPAQTIVECLTMGKLVVTLPAACAIGDFVIFDNVTGAISTISPITALPSGKTFAQAIVDYFIPNGSGSQLAVVAVNPTYVIPQPA